MRFLIYLLLAALLTGCVAPPKPVSTIDAPAWSGRLSITIDGTANQASQQISAGFSLSGSPKRGQLDLFTPLGGKAAELAWHEGSAVLTTADNKTSYPDLPTAVQRLTGADIPIPQLFGWLQGHQEEAFQGISGWRADLTRHSDGRITASRDWPAPKIVLRVVLE